MANRYSYPNVASPGAPKSAAHQATQVSTTSLLDVLHTVYTSEQTYQLDATTSLAVNTWLTASTSDLLGNPSGSFDRQLATSAWEHARRRAEDNCIILGSLHQSTPSLFTSFLLSLPFPLPAVVQPALGALRPFLSCVTPANAATFQHSALSAAFSISLDGRLTKVSFAISKSGIDVKQGLLSIPSEAGYRAFDVFYYLFTSASTPAEREFLGLKPASSYSLLNKSSTYSPPSYLYNADDAAAAEDFRTCLKEIGIKGSVLRGLLSVLAGLLKLGDTLSLLIDDDVLEDICEDVAGLWGVEPEVLIHLDARDREVLIAAIYEALVDWVIGRANEAISTALHDSAHTPSTDAEEGDSVTITVVEIPQEKLAKAVALRTVFDDTTGINAEMKDDGVEIITAGHSVLQHMSNAVADVETDLGIEGGPLSREREQDNHRKQNVLEKVAHEVEAGEFLKPLLYPVEGQGLNVIHHRFDLPTTMASSRVWFHLSIHPTDEPPATLASRGSTTPAWSAGTVSRQLRDWRLPEWANRRNRHLDFTADFDIDEFVTRYSQLGCQDGNDGIQNWILERGWSNGEVVIGHERIWMRESAWWEAESLLDLKSGPPFEPYASTMNDPRANPFESGYSPTPPVAAAGGYFSPAEENEAAQESRENLLGHRQSFMTLGAPKSIAATKIIPGGDYGLGSKGDNHRDDPYYDEDIGQYSGELDPELGDPKKIETKPVGAGRRAWVSLVWALTFWIPSPMLRFVGRMKRPDVRMAWREKFVLVLLIFLLNAIVVFYIIEFGRLLCPNFDKAWNDREVSTHQGEDDFYVSIHGKVYDVTKFWREQHSDNGIDTSSSTMLPLAGQNLDAYFPPPLSRACPGLDVSDTVTLQHNNTNAVQYPQALHTSGPILQPAQNTALHSWNWYSNKFVPKITEYYKGDLVFTKGNVTRQAQNDQRYWVIINDKIYDLTDYFYTIDMMNGYNTYKFFPDAVTELFQENAGSDITDKWGDNASFQNSLNCLNNAFYVGKVDFRKSAKCQVNNYILLAFTIVLCAVILIKFLAALQLGTKKRPAPQDKFVICQVPAYTEGEDQLRKGLDSLTALQYDNKRKLICVICDGMIVGGGNDRPTPKIVLDILGVDPKIDPPALPFRSVGTGSEQLNYGKVYSGLYEYEGNVVPYLVVVKVGKESEQTKSKPGNRGKRDSQILLLQFLNRIHHRAAMNPLELEMFHQINNVIGVDPELYEYLLMVDADTSVREDSLNRLVSACANDAKIVGICGETSLENEEGSWWTMIQVYEYYISHHLAKSFESLFGSVTCLPGCFSMYRLRTSDKGRPLIISDKVISEYSDGQVDTLHKKNLLSLGEDRYLTTLMTKHFPAMSFKFLPDAYALTAAPDTWSVLLSQRRRWINSTIHNLAELVFLKDLCGFCFFSMRFVVFIDLFGTLILPATTAYIAYLIYRVASHSGQFPLISIIMIAGVYGLQALIFIIRRQWQHVGWMIIYILAFPIYSFVLPVYSFWNQDNFSWGNTRIVIGEKGNKRVVAVDDEGFDPRSVPLQRWDDYAAANNLPGRRGNFNATSEKYYDDPYAGDAGFEMDDMHSTYSAIKPASTILTGFPVQHPGMGPYMAPPQNRQSVMSGLTQYQDQPVSVHGRPGSISNISQHQYRNSMGVFHGGRPSLSGIPTSGTPVSMVGYHNRGASVDFRGVPGAGPDDFAIVDAIRGCLAEVDLDSITKKQVRALVEQRLQTELTGERKAFLDRQIDTELANMSYTAADAFYEALWEAGVTYCFVNLGSDHPALMEAMTKGLKYKNGNFPTIITCPNEMVALSMADGYARVTGKPQAVVVHVDVGTQALSCAVHNAHIARTPVLIFAGLCPSTIEGEERGSRTEFVNYLQDIPDQSAIVRQYCRYTNEIRTGKNVKQIVNRALQFANSAPKGPVYLYAAREILEQEIEPYHLDQKFWRPISPSGLPQDAVQEISEALVQAEEPLVVTGYIGRDMGAPAELVRLAETIKGLRVLDTAIGDVCFPADHPAWLGGKYAAHTSIESADVILVVDCDVPWVPTQCRPRKDAVVYHIDVDPLKAAMPVFYIDAIGRWKADTCTSIKQLNDYISTSSDYRKVLASSTFTSRASKLRDSHTQLLQRIASAATPSSGPSTPLDANLITSLLKNACPATTIWAVEAVTNTFPIHDQLQCTTPGTYISSAATGLGWGGGASLGIKLATDTLSSSSTVPTSRLANPGRFVTQIVGDGVYLFSHPSPVYWISTRYKIPVLAVVLNNKGWNAPRSSLQLVHPTGEGSRVSNRDLNISFDNPSPDYPAIAKAASGGVIGTGYASTYGELQEALETAVQTVKSGRTFVLECRLKGFEGNVTAAAPAGADVLTSADNVIENGHHSQHHQGQQQQTPNGKRKFDQV